MLVPIDRIKPNPMQPRKREFGDLEGLARSIKRRGLIQPVVVEYLEDGFYQLIDGERRWRAVQLLGQTMIKVVLQDEQEDQDRLLNALVANLQREDLDPIDEAESYQRLIEEFGWTNNRIARELGTNIVQLKNRLKLLKLEKPIQNEIRKGNWFSDPKVNDELQELEPEVQTALVNRLAKKEGLTRSGARYAIRRVKTEVEKIEKRPEGLEVMVPDVKIAAIRVGLKKKTYINSKLWNALKQAGAVPPWSVVEDSALYACSKCGLHEMADETICKDCPLTWFVRRVMEHVND